MKKIFLICFSMLACVFDVNAALNCTQDVPAGKYCKTAGNKPDCPEGCYCTGSKHAVGNINVVNRCAERTNESGLNASGIYFCPEGTTSLSGSDSAYDCYSIGSSVTGDGETPGGGKIQCPEGCFCLNGGMVDLDLVKILYGWTTYNYSIVKAQEFLQSFCNNYTLPLSSAEISICNINGFVEHDHGSKKYYIVCDRQQYLYMALEHSNVFFIDEFSELYFGLLGSYGNRNGDMVYFTNSTFHDNTYQCPIYYPLSDSGAKTVYECYKYDASGNKVYYGTNTNITCAEGTYLPANATQCVSCNASLNHVCPGGRFEKSDVIQGLKLNCPKGKYLPANATQCSACDESHYFCFGGIYDFSATMDQGLVTHNGYVNMGTHTFITCNPGHYVPANTNQCSACSGDYACPGGLFFTDSSYDVDRGNILCWYGTPNSTHTACMPKIVKPSLLKKSLNQTNTTMSSLIKKQKIGKNEPVVSVGASDSVSDSEIVSPQPTNEKTDTKKIVEAIAKDVNNVKKETEITTDKLKKTSLDRAVTRRQESTSVSENNAISTKPIVHRSAKAIPQTSNSVQTDTTRERPDHIKRPSRGR